ncbi:unnamed protein product [Phytophthora fragariaefolia]|uniref:Unnamed protein product n=1 Tax=Phytophthora fragariaefolia TaxID=1490495 RepID=A0A9W6XZA4_9STRA|nr:unnamed protein product [Phytophthora fragariaefolia]
MEVPAEPSGGSPVPGGGSTEPGGGSAEPGGDSAEPKPASDGPNLELEFQEACTKLATHATSMPRRVERTTCFYREYKLPVFYILSTSRSGDSYWDMVHFVVQATDQQLEPAEIVCDFEAALMDSLQTQFTNAIVLGCLFHLKQAFRRAMKRYARGAMKRYAIPEEECVIAMVEFILDRIRN